MLYIYKYYISNIYIYIDPLYSKKWGILLDKCC